MSEYVYLTEKDYCVSSIYVGTDDEGVRTYLEYRETDEDIAYLEGFSILAALKNNNPNSVPVFLFITTNLSLGIAYSQLIQNTTLCVALDMIENNYAITKVLEYARCHFSESLMGLASLSSYNSKRFSFDEWESDHLANSLDAYYDKMTNDHPFSWEMKQSVKKYLVVRDVKSLREEDIELDEVFDYVREQTEYRII